MSASDDSYDDLDPFDEGSGTGAISTLLGGDVVYVEPTASIRAAAERLRDADVGLAVVGAPGDVVGVVSERDIVGAVAAGHDLETTIVDAIETFDLRWATENTSIADAADEMLGNHLRHLLVRDEDGGMAGVVSMRDVLAAVLP